jgi:hypothetical protein
LSIFGSADNHFTNKGEEEEGDGCRGFYNPVLSCQLSIQSVLLQLRTTMRHKDTWITRENVEKNKKEGKSTAREDFILLFYFILLVEH